MSNIIPRNLVRCITRHDGTPYESADCRDCRARNRRNSSKDQTTMDAHLGRASWCKAIIFCMTLSLLLLPRGAATATAPSESLVRGFQTPPPETKPWVYWYWISDNISKQGITRDLEAMARVGIGEALIGNVFLDDVPAGKVKVLTEPWWSLIEHAIREGDRVGVHIGMFNCPGWSQSGGPWVKPNQSMRYLRSSELRIQGPAHVARKLAAPAADFQPVATIAFPVPANDRDTLAAHRPRLHGQPATASLQQLIDGDLATAVKIPAEGDKFVLDIQLDEPLTARSLTMIPGTTPWAAECELQRGQADGTFLTVKQFRFDRSNMEIHVGPMPRGPVTVSFPAASARRFRLVLRQISGDASLAEVNVTGAARLESYVEKQLGKMHPTPQPMWGTYLWPAQAEPDAPRLIIPAGRVVQLTKKLSADGVLKWDVPPGEWIILHTGMVPTGTHNAPASPEGQGLEIDKMNRTAARAHFNAFIGQLLKRMPAAERRGFKHVVADSYEQGSENWTDGFGDVFRARYGYDPVPWLPVLTGRIVASAARSNRFLWDLRRLVADRVATEYVGGLRDVCRERGLQLWLENYGHWGFPAEFLQYGGQSDRIGGEFWTVGALGSIECRAASSAANTYGMPIVSAEAFTASGSQFKTAPSDLKARGDWAFCEGINHFVLHVYIEQPWEDRRPGVNAWFGTEFNRHNTWFAASRPWIEYLRRCSFMLQQGGRVADVAYFIGEDTPKMTGIRQPSLPPGHDFDYINAEVIRSRLGVSNGRLTLPNGVQYRVLVLPPEQTMRPEVLHKIRDLIHAGAVVLGKPPVRSPSMENYPDCDQQVRRLAEEIWGQAANADQGERNCGRGRIVWGEDLDSVFTQLDLKPDFLSQEPLRYTHRRAGVHDIYFVANPEPCEIVTTAALRVGNRAPELWWPDSGRVTRPAVYDVVDERVRLPIHLGPYGSVFVVFGRQPASAQRVVSVTRNGRTTLDTTANIRPKAQQSADTTANAARDFTLAMWAKPAADTVLLNETTQGVHGIQSARNDAVVPTHGSTWGDARHAGCGIAIGRNGISVFEHGANYFVPILVYPTRVDGWTHIAVVYRDGQPHLLVNGKHVHAGLRSTHIVHPGTPVQCGAFNGRLGPVQTIPRALTAKEIGKLAHTMPRPDQPLPATALELRRAIDGKLQALFWQPGTYQFNLADKTTRRAGVEEVVKPLEIKGPWDVSFAPGWDAPEHTTFHKLVDWTRHSDPAIQHYAGKATYSTTFVLPSVMAGKPLRLTLGDVRDLATVRLNGRVVGLLWMTPWEVDVSDAARSGKNTLEVDVINTWYNRLVGDAALPPEQRRTFVARQTVPKDAPLRPAGLLGPVVIRAAETMTDPGANR